MAQVEFSTAIPILRIFDEDKARAFYIDFLGFSVEFEHRFAPDLPLYMGIRRDGLRLHLSGHHGDTTPGTRVYLPAKNLAAFSEELSGKPGADIRPGAPVNTSWGTQELTLTDPFGNRLTFAEEV